MKTISIEKFLDNYSPKEQAKETTNSTNYNSDLFTIMSFIHITHNVIRTLDTTGKYRIDNNSISWTLEEMFYAPNTYIHSIKRNSDGKVFTIGDIVKIGIESFEIKDFDKIFVSLINEIWAALYKMELNQFLNTCQL